MKVKKIVVAAALTAISIIIPAVCPKIVFPPFTATFMAHVPIMLAICISTDIAVMVTLGTSVGFFFAFPSLPFGYIRSFSHIFFVMVACYLLNKKVNIFLIIILTGIIHALSEMVLIILLFLPGELEANSIIITLFICTLSHHIVDSLIASLIIIPLKKAKLIKRNFTIKKLKE